MSGEVTLAVCSEKSAKLEIIVSRNLRSTRVFTGRDFGQHRIWRIGVKRFFLKFLSDQSGATAIEYGLIAAGIAIAIITAVNGVGTSLSTEFGNVSTALK
jgi:pilus assembly protein Flp/PilA